MSTPREESQTPTAPMFQVVSGSPTAAELAALVTVLAAAGGGSTDAGPPRMHGWNNRSMTIRPQVQHGHGAWRMSQRLR